MRHAHDVFISYANADKATADMVCAMLEQRAIRCWMAPRDINPGDDWGRAIVSAIRASRALVLVFSEAANASRHIPRELERAIDHEIPVIPFRVENVPARGSLEYSLSSVHWLDAITPPLEGHVRRLADSVARMLGIDTPPPTRSVPAPPAPPPLAAPEIEPALEQISQPAESLDDKSTPPGPAGKGIAIAVAVAGAALVFAVALAQLTTGRQEPGPSSEPSTPTPAPVSTTAPPEPNAGAASHPAAPGQCATVNACLAEARAFRAGAAKGKEDLKAEPFEQRACDLGGFQACVDLGSALKEAVTLPEDQGRALALFRRACDHGNGEGCYELGQSHDVGLGVPKDAAAAAGFYQRGCDLSEIEACHSLAIDLFYGAGLARDVTRSVTLYARACDEKRWLACASLAKIYESGDAPTLPPDPAKAASLYERACSGELWESCTGYGRLLMAWKGIDQFAAKAQAAFQKACKNGDKPACDAIKAGTAGG